MPQLQKGARRAIERIEAAIAAAQECRSTAYARLKYNPDYARDQLEAQDRELTAVLRIVRDELEPLLERQAPQYDKRLAELERRIEAIEGNHKVVPLRREA